MKRAFAVRLKVVPALLLALCGACTQAVNVAPPRAFNRPARMELVCFSGDRPVAQSECATGSDASDRTLLALVTQQTRGEVAAVDLSADPPVVIDSDRRVPGFTFVEVGEVPVGLAVSHRNPLCTWVANRGSSSLSAVETARFREESLGTGMDTEELSLAGEGRTGRPNALVIHDDGATSELYVTLPDDGVIGRVPVMSDETGCRFGALEVIPLPDALPVEPTEPSPDPTLVVPTTDQDPATIALCAATGLTLPELATPPPTVTLEAPPDPLPAPQPLEIEVARDDEGNAVALLIGDAARPVIYRYDLATRAFVDGIRTDGPILDLTLTPAVPDRLDEATTRRYIYAIDARDGSVMVIDESVGQLVPVAAESTGRVLRVPFGAPARAIAAIDRRGDAGMCDYEDATIDPSANNLRGVFVSVALSDGTIRYVDVLDEDAPCRTGENCQESFQGGQQYSFIRRHRPRIASRVADPVSLTDPPVASLSGSTQRFSAEGSVPDEDAVPSFQPIVCEDPDGIAPVFGAPATLICTSTDPWTAEPESWALTWQGVIPSTASIAGNFRTLDDGRIALETRIPLCERGVLGPEGAAGLSEDQPEHMYPGDLVAITAELPDATAEDPECRALAGVDVGETPEPLLVRIDEVRVGEAAGVRSPYASAIVLAPDAEILDREGANVELLLRCYQDQLVSFDVRVGDRYAVVGSRTGFVHRVIVSDAGNCVVDTAQSSTLNARAELGVPYVGPSLRFELAFEEGRPAVIVDQSITFDVGDVPVQLATDLGLLQSGGRTLTLPNEVMFSALTDRLYALDELRRGLVVIELEPVGPEFFIE
ncbi:hypothetical protein [Sandaracinus amylolyticus]|uniref:hypothetical protein n=1 Tax=Sandaracinus amylolyticus TaxID=927083 RepID=UPI001F385553|nr:hypothetical protein [Sandaracinus amylolyticus]UJR80790.1 Hypothetical protein I5071_28400 [Sandaracinus amylolyticus]